MIISFGAGDKAINKRWPNTRIRAMAIELDRSKVLGKALEHNDFMLFSESNSRFLIEVEERDRQGFEALIKRKPSGKIGKVRQNKQLFIHGQHEKTVDVSVASCI